MKNNKSILLFEHEGLENKKQDEIPTIEPSKTELPQTENLDPFADISKLRLSQNFSANLGVKKLIVTLPVRKPNKETYIRTHPNPAYWLDTAVIELKEDNETYLVSPLLWPELEEEPTFAKKVLITTINRQNVLFLWPVKLPDSNGKLDEWNRSALEAANLAKAHWVRVKSNRSLGAYDVDQAIAEWGEPTWPETPFNEMLKIAFRDRFIDSFKHPVLRRLRGEI